MNNVTILLNRMKIKERSDGRYEGRFTINNKRKSIYGSSKAEVKQRAKPHLQQAKWTFYQNAEKPVWGIPYWDTKRPKWRVWTKADSQIPEGSLRYRRKGNLTLCTWYEYQGYSWSVIGTIRNGTVCWNGKQDHR